MNIVKEIFIRIKKNMNDNISQIEKPVVTKKRTISKEQREWTKFLRGRLKELPRKFKHPTALDLRKRECLGNSKEVWLNLDKED